MKKKIIVLDTSVFVNPDSGRIFGSTPTKAFTRFLDLAKNVPQAEFLMPPTIYKELMHFVEENRVPRKLLLSIQVKPPKKHEVKIPGFFLYKLVENMRDRIDRGLRLAERHAREALQMDPPPKEKAHAKEIRPDAEIVGRLRESYRRIMREGMLDSEKDVELLLLAYESEASLVTADQGVLEWAKDLGISLLPHEQLMDFLTENSQPGRV
jgi:hypothetical protein